AQIAHQPRHTAPGNIKPFPLHLPPDLAHAVDAEVLGKDPHDFRLEYLITLRSDRPAARITTLRNAFVVARWGDRQNPADRLDPICIAVLINERDHRLNGRSSSAWAKYAEALRRISLACRSSRFS